MRVEGSAGIGKSRTVLEALRIPGLAERTLYSPDADSPHSEQLLDGLAADQDASAIIVFDECSRDRQDTFRKRLDYAREKIRAVCVGVAERLTLRRHSCRASLKCRNCRMNYQCHSERGCSWDSRREIRAISVRLSDEYVKLAMFIQETLIRERNLPLTELVEIPDIQQFLAFVLDGKAT